MGSLWCARVAAAKNIHIFHNSLKCLKWHTGAGWSFALWGRLSIDQPAPVQVFKNYIISYILTGHPLTSGFNWIIIIATIFLSYPVVISIDIQIKVIKCLLFNLVLLLEMVRHYKRKTQRGVTTAILEEAYNDIKVNGVKINAAATKYEIDRMTLTR